MVLTFYSVPFLITRTGDSTFATSNPDSGTISRNIADELIECICDPQPFNATNTAVQFAWTTGQTQTGTNGVGSKEEICDVCEEHTNARTATASDGLKLPYYWDSVTKKCVAPGTSASPVSISPVPVISNPDAGPVLRNAVVYLIFWGPWTGQSTLKATILDNIQNKLLGTDIAFFNTAKADYDGFSLPVWGGTLDYTAHLPANTAAYKAQDLADALAALLQAPPPGFIDPTVHSYTSQEVHASQTVYVWVPDPSWRVVTGNDPSQGLGFAWEAFHWTKAFGYDIAGPPPPPDAPPPGTPSPPPGNVDVSGLGDNTIDGLLSTAWSGNVKPFITWNVGFPLEISTVKVAWLDGNKKMYFFDIDWSVDDTTWNNIAPVLGTPTWRSSGTTTQLESYTFSSVIAQYIRFTGRGNNGGTGTTATNDQFGIAEVELWGPDVPSSGPPSGGTAPPPPPGQSGTWVWTGTEWVFVPSGGGGCGCTDITTPAGTPPSSIPQPPSGTGNATAGTPGGTGNDPGTITGVNTSGSTPPIVTIFKDFIDSYNIGVTTGDLCAADNAPQSLPLTQVYNSPVASNANYTSMAMAGAECQRVGEAIMTDASQLIGLAPRKVTITMKRVGSADGLVYCRIRDSKNNIVQEIDTFPAAAVGLNDTTMDFQNDGNNYVMKKGDILWIEYADPSATDGNTYLMFKISDKDNYDAVNSIFVKYTNTTIPDALTDLAAVISV